MKKNDFLKREALIKKLSLDLIEVSKVFSLETLNSMMMSHVVGGDEKKNDLCDCHTKCGGNACGIGNCSPSPCGSVSVSVSLSYKG